MQLHELDASSGIALFTDGSAWYKDGSGGWAWLAIDVFDGECHASGSATDTTNNRMEMTAWIEGLNAVFDALGPCEIIMYSDSEYVGLGAMDKLRHRRKNLDLWKLLDDAVERHTFVQFFHVRGHAGHCYNEKVDRLAGEARIALSATQ